MNQHKPVTSPDARELETELRNIWHWIEQSMGDIEVIEERYPVHISDDEPDETFVGMIWVDTSV